jgi:ferrous iron transport protein B
MWERGWSFIRKAGTIILLSTILVWFLSRFGMAEGTFRMLEEEELELSILARAGSLVAWVFAPLGFGTWQATVASFTGLIAKENIVGTMGILYGGTQAYANLAASFTGLAAFSFLVFNLLCAPCFAAIGAIRREMNHAGWTWFAIAYQCGFAYAVSLVIYQVGGLFAGNASVTGLIAALAVLGTMIWMLFFKKYEEATKLTRKVA